MALLKFNHHTYKIPFPYFIKSVGEEYQVVKRGREYYGCGEKYNVDKGEGNGNFGKKIQDLKRRVGKNIKYFILYNTKELYTPLVNCQGDMVRLIAGDRFIVRHHFLKPPVRPPINHIVPQLYVGNRPGRFFFLFFFLNIFFLCFCVQ